MAIAYGREWGNFTNRAPLSANTDTASRYIVIPTTASPATLDERIRQVLAAMDEFRDCAEKQEEEPTRCQVPHGPCPELSDESRPRRVRRHRYRVNLARPPPWRWPAIPGQGVQMTAEKSALDVLADFHSWQLHRVSHTTYPSDVVVTMKRTGQPLSDDEAAVVAALMRNGSCYRCRIGKGRFYFAASAYAAAKLAAAAATPEKPPCS